MMFVLLVCGMLAGLAGGLVAGTLLTVMTVTDPTVTLMQRLSGAIGADGLLAGWLVILGLSAVIGGLFAGLIGRRRRDEGTVVSAALLLGLGLWLVAALAGVPLLVGVAPVVGLAESSVWPIIAAMLMPNLLFASVLAAVFLGLRSWTARTRGSDSRALQRAA